MSKPSGSNLGGDLTWPALLARWTAFAQSSLALPKNAAGDRWRAAVPAIINLQAVTFALEDLDRLTRPGEKALALDKAEIIIRSGTGQLHALWRGDVVPTELVALIHDAGTAIDAARAGKENQGTASEMRGTQNQNQGTATESRGTQNQSTHGIEWRVTEERLVVGHPSDLVERLLELTFNGDLWVATPGVPMFHGAPAAFVREPDGARPSEHVLRAVKEFLIDVSRPEPVDRFRQVYRQFDFAAGRAVRDLVVPMGVSDGPAPGGQPLLVPAIRGGKEVAVTLPPRKSAEIPATEVVFQDVPTDSEGP
jgi:hypothetical protein